MHNLDRMCGHPHFHTKLQLFALTINSMFSNTAQLLGILIL